MACITARGSVTGVMTAVSVEMLTVTFAVMAAVVVAVTLAAGWTSNSPPPGNGNEERTSGTSSIGSPS